MTAEQADTSPPPVRDLKRKRDADQQLPEAEAKVREFLEVMQPPSKSRTWANEGLHGKRVQSVSPPTEAHRASVEPTDAEQRQPPRKSKDSPKSMQKHELTLQSNPKAGDQASATEISASNEAENKGGETLPQASDADWLRSRTSRLLDLIDDDDEIVSKASDTKLESAETREKPGHKVERDMSHAGSQTDGDYTEKASEPPGSNNSDPPKPSIATGRLFVRNLAYTTTESDLRAHLKNIGFATTEEVSKSLGNAIDRSITSRFFMMIILIGTAYAMHMMLPGRVF